MDDTYILREAKVLSADDPYDGKRIKVRLGGLDGTTNEKDLPYCYPLMPKLVHAYPKEGELVLVILQKIGSGLSNRFYIGPVISQANSLLKELADTTAANLLNDRKAAPTPNPSTDPENAGTLPDQDDIALLGRLNTDLILKESEVRLRCGFKSEPKGSKKVNLHFNKIDPAYIQMKYNKLITSDGKEVNSVINMVADRINLISHDSSLKFQTTDPKALITDDEQKKILDNAHPLIYGDELVNFLKKLVEIIRTHEHPFHQDEPTFNGSEIATLNTDLNLMLSKSIRIN